MKKVASTPAELLSTTATFSKAGSQTIRLSATDGEITTFKTTTVDVTQLLISYAEWAANIDWQGRDSSATSVDNLHRTPNIILFAMDLHPLLKKHEAPFPRLTKTNNQSLTLTYRRNKQVKDLIFYPESSDNLITWNALDPDSPGVTVTVVDANIDGDGSAELIQVKFEDIETNARFFRLFSELE